MARRWIKLWVADSLRGTMRFDFTPAERGVWYDLLILAGDCRQEGLISPGENAQYPLKWIAGTLNISTSLLKKTLEKCKTFNRIEVNSHGIRILNWSKYQSEYERQKPFREAKYTENSYNKVTAKVTTKVMQKLPVEGEEEIEIEEEERINKKDNFETFWKAYPKKKSKGQAEKVFFKISPDEKLLSTILTTIDKAKESVDWQKDNGQFIPYPATWLNARGWEDEITLKEFGNATTQSNPRKLPTKYTRVEDL